MRTTDQAGSSAAYPALRGWCNSAKLGKSIRGQVEIAYLASGGAVLTLQGGPVAALFDLGKIEVTEAAIRSLDTVGQSIWPFLLRHVRGDWGVYGRMGEGRVTGSAFTNGRFGPRHVTTKNQAAVMRNDGRVVSDYGLGNGKRVWVITHLGSGGYTAFLTPADS